MSASPNPWRFKTWAYSIIVGNPARKSVLNALATLADSETGRCEAKVSTLERYTELSDKTIRRHLEVLEETGLIARRAQTRNDGGRRGDQFLLLADGVVEWPDGTPAPLVRATGNPLVSVTGDGQGDRGHPPTVTGGPLPHSDRARTTSSSSELPLRNAAAAREDDEGFQPFARPSLPADGEDIGELVACLQQLADWAGDQEDRLHRRFASGWMGDAGRVRLLLEAEPAAVRLQIVDYVLRAVAAGWQSTGVAKAISGQVLVKARDQADQQGRGVKSRDERLSEQQRLEEERAAGSAAYFASLRGDDGVDPEPAYDFEAEAIEDPHPTDDGDAS